MSVKIRFKQLAGGDKSVYLDIYYKGTRQYEFTSIRIHRNDPLKKEKMELVEQLRSNREMEFYQSGYGITGSRRKNQDFIKYYEDYVESYIGKDIRLMRYSLSKFRSMIKRKDLPFALVTPKLCNDYAQYLKSQECGLTGETPYNYFTKFRRVLKEAVIEGILRANPADGIVVRRKTNQIKKNVLTEVELQSLAGTPCANPEIKKAFLFSCYTGFGVAEIRKLKVRDVQNEKLILYRQKSKEQVINDIHPVAQHLLGQLESRNPDEVVFRLPSDTSIAYSLKLWVKRAGINKNISYYCSRHTYACQLLLNGANLKTVADCLGHSTTTHTLKYLNYVDQLKSDAIKNLPDLEFHD